MTPDKSERSIDLADCEREPICHLGLIQSHGILISLNAQAEVIHVSENIGQLFPVSANYALSRPLAEVMGAGADQVLQTVLPALQPGEIHRQFWAGQSKVHQAGYSFCTHQIANPQANALYILEWEPLPVGASESDELVAKFLADGLAELQASAQIHRKAQLAAELVKKITGYDRVMVYRFHPDWSGEVIAEVRNAMAEPYLGLRYPASDIPPQARKLYTQTLLRVLVDVNATPVNLLSLPGNAAPLDLTHSQVRAMSPYHVEYLKNMKVGATATASLMNCGNLWGLIACHHDRRKAISPCQKEALSRIAQTLSAAIESFASRARQVSAKRLATRKTVLYEAIPDADSALNAILFGPERLRKLIHCCGMALWTESGVLRMGDAPAVRELAVYAARVLEGSADIVACQSRADLTAQLGLLPEQQSLAGLVAIVASRQPALLLFGFRLEVLREISWGGDINHPVLRDERTGALSPRRSFAHFKQSVSGQASDWTEEDLASAQIVLDVLGKRFSDPQQTTAAIRTGFAGLRELVTGEFTLQDSLLDVIGSGISLLFRSDADALTLRYANQTLMDLAETCSESERDQPDSEAPELGTLLSAIGLPRDVVTNCDTAPHQVTVQTPTEGIRHFVVERKLALEVSDSSGTVSLSALLFTDTTRGERAREALQAAQERAAHLYFLKSSFLANVSHEIRTPMNGILGMVQLMQTTNLDPEQQGYLNVIGQSGDMMLRIINDILDLSKIEAGRMQLEHLPFDLTAVVQGVVDLLRPSALEKSIDICPVFDTPPPRWFEGDSHRLRQVLLNIAGNAIKFTSVGRVQLRVHSDERSVKAGLVNISISDTGIGVSDEQMVQIFEKFHQADSSTTRKYGGTGLGLAISRELVSLMGGTISLSSRLGVGSTFTVALPLARSNTPHLPTETELLSDIKARGPGAGRRILVAEDDLSNQIVIEEILKTKGFDVAIAATGRRALELLELHTWDLILMDCQMPDLDGYKTAKLIRALEGLDRHTPIIALTAHAFPEDRERCMNAGMDDYLAKPVQIVALWDALRKWNCLPPVDSNGKSIPSPVIPVTSTSR